jgi:small-conductance mechanosensitive channel
MFDYLIDQGWLPWFIGIIIVYPMMVILIGEVGFRIRNKHPLYANIFKNIQFILLPSYIIMEMMDSVIGIPNSNIFVKIFSTIFWISVIVTIVSLFNIFMVENKKAKNVPKLLVDLARIFLIILGIAFVISNIWEVDLTKLLAALGVGSVVLGLALQDTLGGILSGFALLSGKQFNIGDWLKIDDVEGQIEGMDWRSVTLKTRENDYLVIPNARLASERFKNFTKPTSLHMERVQFDISFDDAPHKVKQILIDVAKHTNNILKDPSPHVALLSYDEFSVKYEMQYYIDNYSHQPEIRDDFISSVWYAASRDGFVFPTRSHEVYHFDTNDKDQENEVEIISKFKEFSIELTQEQYKEIIQNAKLYNFGKGEVILKQQEISNLFYLITKGKVEESYFGRNGKKYRIEKIQKGEFFGIRTLTSKHENSVTTYAIEDVEVIVLNKTAMKTLVKYKPEFIHTIELVMKTRDAKLKKIKNALKRTSKNKRDS